ncbi:aminoglycoside phosphotransferase family protein [Caulobacter sp.]|uniref:phosphotransferase family protein n=1 Tax=Caulobacter sp. TaxID=78 RepID=UPI001AFF13C2|nr:aminoglycoside phosphotransferase family protein [Caulobacter sp.]MBO9545871.1 aminoglycoside phosphotransferase family protein [Caulobacter sp.]
MSSAPGDAFGESLARAGAVLGHPPGALRVLRAGGGGGADVAKIEVAGLPGAYAFRRRKPITADEPERWIPKDAVCAFLTHRFSHAPVDAAALAGFLAAPTGRDLPFRLGADLLGYGLGSALTGRSPWSIATWLDAPRLLDRPDVAAYADLGRCLKAVHDVRFEGLWPELDRPGEGVCWDQWIGFMFRHFATPSLAAQIGQDAVETILRLRPSPPSALVLVHGDVHPANALVCEQGIRMIDWDEAGVGAPERDFAVLRYRTRQFESGLIGPDRPLFDAAIDGYRRAGGQLDERQMRVHQLLFLLKQLALPRQPRHVTMTAADLAAEALRLVRQLG